MLFLFIITECIHGRPVGAIVSAIGCGDDRPVYTAYKSAAQ